MKPKSAITLVALAIATDAAGGYWLGSRNAPTLSADGAQTETGRKVLYWYDPMAPAPASINRESHRLWIWIWCRATPTKGAGEGGRERAD